MWLLELVWLRECPQRSQGQSQHPEPEAGQPRPFLKLPRHWPVGTGALGDSAPAGAYVTAGRWQAGQVQKSAAAAQDGWM